MDPQNANDPSLAPLWAEFTRISEQLTKVSPRLGFQFSNVVISPLSGTIAANTDYILPSVSMIYSIYIPKAYLVASSGGPFTLTLKTSIGGTDTVIVPIAKAGDTITSGNLLFDIYIDPSGNVSSKAWRVSGSNSNGNWVKFDDGTMIEWGTVTHSDAINIAYSGGFRSGNPTWPLPAAFIDTNYVMQANNANYAFGSQFYAGTSSTMGGYLLSVTSTGAATRYSTWLAIGKWK